MLKSDIINLLGRRHGLTRYLEIATATTGAQYAKIDRRQFSACTRLVYHWSRRCADGLPVDFPVAGEAIEGVMAGLVSAGARFDAILVDPWHSYECSLRDLRLALPLLSERGFLLVHDCSPPSFDLAGPVFRADRWCGLTYAAFLDFVLADPALDYATVDTDYGCAIVRRPLPVRAAPRGPRPAPEIVEGWHAAGADTAARYRFFDRHRADLLNLIPVQVFLDRENVRTVKAS